MEIDQLFESLTIKEIKQQNIKTRTEIEKKKEELRFLVSERYRDIIDAADTIFEMKTCAADINESIKTISNIYKNWNCLMTLPYEPHIILIDKDIEKKQKKLSLVAQIKLILNMSELIWNALETKKFSNASMLFNTCRNMSIYSQVMGDRYQDEELNIQLIFNRHWSSLSNLETTIGLTCRNFLKSINFIHTPNEVLDSLLGIILLEEQNISYILSEYLNCVDNQIKEWFSSAKSCLPINQQLYSVAEIIMRAISNVYQLFMNNVLINRLNELFLISVRDMECTQEERIYQYLPNEISSYKPVQKSNHENNINHDNLLEITNEWLKSCRDKYASFFVGSFKHLTTVKSIGEIRIQLEKIFDNILTESNKSQDWLNLEKENSEEWKRIIKSMYSTKLKEIIDEKISLYFTEWTKGIEKFMTSNVNLLNEEEFDGDSFFNYFWTEFNKDVFFHSDFPAPSYITDNPSLMYKMVFETLYHHFLNFFDIGSSISNKSCSFESLVVKYKVVRPEIYQITRLFNKQLLELITEVIGTINDNEDFLWVILKNCLISIVDRCVNWSTSLNVNTAQESCSSSEVLNHANVFCFVNDRTNKMITVDQLKIIIVSQSMRTIYELLPSFQAGLMTAVFNSENLKSPNVDDKVVQKRKLKSSRLPFLPGKRINHQQDLELTMWNVWNDVIEPIKQTINELVVRGTESSISNFIKTYFQFAKHGLSSVVASDEICTKWMAINLNQEANNDLSVPIEVPIQCSWPMHILLFKISHLLSIFGAHSISGKCNDAIRLQILNMIIDNFQSIMKSDEFQENKFIQKQNVQLIFDIRFLLEIINAKTGIDKGVQDCLRDLLRDIEKYVDPFDYEMMSEILHQNLSQNVAKNSSIYWLLSSNQPKRNLSFGQKLDIGTAQHNLIDLVGSGSSKNSKNNLRFGMLPVSGYTMIDKNSSSNSSKVPATVESKPVNLPSQNTSSKSVRSVTNFSLNTQTTNKSYFGRLGTNWF